ncbi:hypothetical protein EHQ68_09380 [Leptospira congkakensis]|uniref:Uncharacterized protein n=1 Tax=Leptospira congkakensis TaxID=2484932 RepID=A0A4Z0ZYK2_9LEPT|nr:hypothetical protein [Leptospira congkakensis]TGL85968.1 hypothetical protein EHQ69_17975 [Leptospira congkakensis]TGL88841.1 hypothetical protein EHQ68_09380 [Leptospira congkakensis]TGL93346.1 hypothetical protein EHQ70_17545 [Leptospira congkakensis]
MKLLVGILLVLFQCTSLDRRTFFWTKNSPAEIGWQNQDTAIAESGFSSECLLPPDGQYPFPRMNYCYVGSRPLTPQPSTNRNRKEMIPLSFSVVPIYAYEGHANPEIYKDVTFGRGPFHNRSLKENILRQSMQQSLPGKISSPQHSLGVGR